MSDSAECAANRYGLGARSAELKTIQSDPRGWLLAQINGNRATPEALLKLPSSAEVFTTQFNFRKARNEAKKATDKDKDAVAAFVDNLKKTVAPLYLDQVAARYQIAAASDEPFRERLIHFWSNHFAVSADKAAVLALAGTLENEAIRPNLNRHFADMLLAVEMHPAMLLYLDNATSIGPHSQIAERATRRNHGDRKIGINENLGREILELHTLGVNGGYTQTDVTTFAQALTGWSLGGGEGRLQSGVPGEFVFREGFHEPGSKTILGKRYTQEGYEQARAVLSDLAMHPATAQHLATKLVRHFAADDPPPAAVERIAKIYLNSEGHLPTVHRALVEMNEAWQMTNSKYKTPHEYAISAFRALDYLPNKPQQVAATFELLGQRPYTPGSPAGWPDTANQWDGPDALMKRIEWASQLSQRVGTRSHSPLQLAQDSLGAWLGEHTRDAIKAAADVAQGLTLWLVSPEFMRR